MNVRELLNALKDCDPLSTVYFDSSEYGAEEFHKVEVTTKTEHYYESESRFSRGSEREIRGVFLSYGDGPQEDDSLSDCP